MVESQTRNVGGVLQADHATNGYCSSLRGFLVSTSAPCSSCPSAPVSTTEVPASSGVPAHRTPSWIGCLLFVLGLVGLVGPAPSAAQDELHLDQPWAWVDFQPSEDFPSHTVREMGEALDTVWLRTDRTIHWFDGFRWSRVTAEDGLPSGAATSISVAPGGQVTVVIAGRAYQSRGTEFTPVPVTDDFEAEWNVVRAVPLGDNDLMVSAIRSTGAPATLLVSDGVARDVTRAGDRPVPTDLWVTDDGDVYGHSLHGLLRWSEGQWNVVAPPPNPRFTTSAFASAPGERPLAAAGDFMTGWALLDPSADGAPSTRLEGNDRVQSVTLLEGDASLTTHENGSLRLHTASGSREVPIPGTRGNGIRVVYADRLGDLWFAGDRGLHLYRRSSQRWSAIEYPGLDPRNRVNSMLALPGGDLWLGTHAGVLRYRYGREVEWLREIEGDSLGPVTGLTQDADGGIWVSAGANFLGTARLKDGQWSRLGPEQGFDGGTVHRIHTTRDGTVWLLALGDTAATRGGAGVFRYTADGFERFEDPDGFLRSRAYGFSEGEDGALWFGTLRGLSRWQDGVWTHWSSEDGLGEREAPFRNQPRVFAVLADPDGGAWFGYGHDSPNGLGRVLPDGELVHYFQADGIPGNSVIEIGRAPDGEMWISTDGGGGRHADGIWAGFDGTTGLDPVNTWPLEFDENGVLFGTTRGVRRLDRSEEGDPPPEITLSTPATVQGPVVRIEWDVQAYRGSMPTAVIRVRTRLDGSEWSPWTPARRLWTTTDSVGGWGDHTLEVQSKGLHGQLSEPFPIAFTVPYPVLLRPVFFGPIGILAMALVGLGVAGRKRRIKAAARLLASERRFRTLVDSAPDAIAIFDASTGRFVTANRRAEVLMRFNWDPEAMPTLEDLGLVDGSHPDAGAGTVRLQIERALAGEQPVFEWLIQGPNGPVPTEVRLARLYSAGRDLVRFSLFDVSARKEAEARRLELEEQLGQAQRIEALGKLTGGVAHDFNNLLTVISGNLELLLDSHGDDEEVCELAASALEAAGRSSLLTARLLAFSRRQALVSQSVDVVELVKGLLDLLERSLGETVTIHTSWSEQVPPALIDPAQLENALVNLAVNARDAMPSGGDVHIEVEAVSISGAEADALEVSAGEFVSLSITDTGTGMPEETRARAFDPFYTTKEVGKGSGLGLSMVYGFVRQSGGMVTLDTRMGLGTRVQLFLPAADLPPQPDAPGDLPTRELAQGAGEHILIVEDEPRVLDFTTRLCARLGYTTQGVATAPEALELLRSDARIDLLFSDVVLPGGMNGVELAIEARSIREGIPVLLTSGYAEQPILELAQSIPDVGVVSKPFDTMTLAERIRAAIEA